MPNDPYATLELQRDATEDDIKRAYRKLARENHPDRNPGDKTAEQRFRDVQQAYDVLGNKEKREKFDRYGIMGDEGPQAGGPNGPGNFHFRWGDMGGDGANDVDADELFSEIFGRMGGGAQGRGRARSARPPQEYSADVAVPFLTAALGGSVDLNVGGKSLSVKIPPGTEDGNSLRLRGQAPGGGDLRLKIQIQDHAYFRREANNIVLQAPISATEAILGAKIDVPTIEGAQLTVTIPAGASSGSRLRLRGKGIKGGDQFIEIKIIAQKPNDDKSRELIEEYTKLNPTNLRDTVAWR